MFMVASYDKSFKLFWTAVRVHTHEQQVSSNKQYMLSCKNVTQVLRWQVLVNMVLVSMDDQNRFNAGCLFNPGWAV